MPRSTVLLPAPRLRCQLGRACPCPAGVDYLRGTGQWEYLQTGVRLPQDGTLEVTAGTSGTGEAVYFDNLRVEQTGGLIVQEQHQYAFGAPLPGLSYAVGSRRYRYGYQGQYAEHDSLTGYESFELRLYSSRVGRWLSYDPEGQFSSPYLGMGNNPVSGVDPTGGWSGPGPFYTLGNITKGSHLIEEGVSVIGHASKGLSAWARIGLQAASSMARLSQRTTDFAVGAVTAYGSDMLLSVPEKGAELLNGGALTPRNEDIATGQLVGHAVAAAQGLTV